MNNELINYSEPSVVDTIKNTILVDANDHELKLFLQVCKSTGLNPFNKEIWGWKDGKGRLMIMTGNAGYWQIANSIPEFDGADSGFDHDKEGNLVSAWCTIYRKDRGHPTKGIALMKECRRGTPIWSERPSMMLLKCAENIALKKAFPHQLNKLDSYETSEHPESDPSYINNVTGINTHPGQQKAIEEPKEEPVIYDIPAVTKEQSMFLQKRGAIYNAQTLLWHAPKDLGEKLKPYLVPAEKLQALNQEASVNA